MKKNTIILVILILSLLASCGNSDVELKTEAFCKELDKMETMTDIDNIPVVVARMNLENSVEGFDKEDEKDFEKSIQSCIDATKIRIGLFEGKRIAEASFKLISRALDSADYVRKVAAMEQINAKWKENPDFKKSYEITLQALLEPLNEKYNIR